MVIVVLTLSNSCRKDDDDFTYTIADYYRGMTTLSIEVAYEDGAAPYTENNNGGNVWTITEDNVEALFAGRTSPVDVVVPNGLLAMTEFPNQQKTTYTSEEILNLADRYRQGTSTTTSGNFFVIYLDGFFEKDGQKLESVLGIQITNTQVAAIFKPVVESTNPFTTVKKLAEQTTVVHELGHGLGLVKNGVPLVSAHHDSDHNAHCTNVDCVMYWQNEGPTAITGFVQQFLQNNTIIVFGAECIADTEAYMP